MQYQWENVILQTSHIWCTTGLNTGSTTVHNYMNDLPLAADTAEITMYADDTSMYRAFNSINSLTDELIPAFGKNM